MAESVSSAETTGQIIKTVLMTLATSVKLWSSDINMQSCKICNRNWHKERERERRGEGVCLRGWRLKLSHIQRLRRVQNGSERVRDADDSENLSLSVDVVKCVPQAGRLSGGERGVPSGT